MTVFRRAGAALLAFFVFINCGAVRTKAEKSDGVELTFGLWSQTRGVFCLPLYISADADVDVCIAVVVTLPEGCEIVGVEAILWGRAAASAFLTVKNRAVALVDLPRSAQGKRTAVLPLRFTAKGGASGRATASAVAPAFGGCAAAARGEGEIIPLTVAGAERKLSLPP